ncbi:hypothetical protein [Skermanella aerolata]|nr:hypothetical protein [Skermanella aerolata]
MSRGNLYVEDGTLRFRTTGMDGLESGDYALPYGPDPQRRRTRAHLDDDD